ncbi:hypothetical protein E2C01_091912 [Portunus trituberculatus]|uniref:Uncharacterized protein n=1 Tax=Portunus trituberculatus TaxID=210409 RepID=A0A5B7JKA7_PORTR|nr:hypothetical protein [Portunus trituberculatus]
MSRVLHQLLQVMEDSKVEGLFTRMVREGRGKPKLVVNIEILKDGDIHNEIERQNVLHFMSEVAKGKTEANLNLVLAKDELNKIQKSLANQPTSEDVTEASGKFFLI